METTSRGCHVEENESDQLSARLQVEVPERMRQADAEVHVVDTVVGVDELVDRLAEA